MTELAEQLVPDLLNVIVPAGARVVVMSDLHFGQNADQSSEIVAADLARLVDSLDGPGVVVLGGDVFELLIENHNDPGRALRSHPRLASALRHFAAGEGRRVIVLLGTHDWPLAWHAPAVRTLQQQIGAELALVVDLVIATGCGVSKVRVEHGHQFDPANAFDDPRNPGESPLAHHVVRELLPLLRKPGAEWLAGLNLLVDPAESAAFVASRTIYRRLARRALTLLVPFLVSALLALVWVISGASSHSPWRTASLVALAFGGWAIAAVALVTLWWRWALQRPMGAFRAIDPTRGAGRTNDAPRRMARRLVGEGYVGYITGHTHQPELVDLGDGFYANTGGGGSVVERRRGRLGFPPAFAVSRRLSWVEIEAGARCTSGCCSLVNRCRRPRSSSGSAPLPVEVGGPQPASRRQLGPTAGPWPEGEQPQRHPAPERPPHRRRLPWRAWRGLGSIVFLSAITPPFPDRLHDIPGGRPGWPYPRPPRRWSPCRGWRSSSWRAACGVVSATPGRWRCSAAVRVTTVLHLAKGLDVGESLGRAGHRRLPAG